MARREDDVPGLLVVTSLVRRRLYAYDATGGEGAVPVAVLYPRRAADVREAVGWARDRGLSLVARGAGTGLSGGAVPEGRTAVITTERMNRILAVDAAQKSALVEPGVVNGALDPLLAPMGLFYAPDPASRGVSTIGGNIAENSGGPHALKYGITGLHVASVSLVDARGREGTFTSGPAQPGCDLVSLVVGSEGTLGIVTRAMLLLTERPARVETALVSFAAIGRATDFVSSIIARGMLPATCEFIDRPTIEAIEAWGVATYPKEAEAVLIVEFDGAPAEVTRAIAALEEAAGEHGALGVEVAADAATRDRLWLGRRGAYAAVARHGRRLLTQDVTVPRQKLTAMMEAVAEIAHRHRLFVATVGHAGDGNLHPDFPYDPDDPDETGRVRAANLEVIEACVALGGSITGEHGVGTDKLNQLALMYGKAELGLMAAVKRALDPEGLLNPGKAVPQVARHALGGEGRDVRVPRDALEVRDAVLHARSAHESLNVALDGLLGIDVDPANLTAEVGAGERMARVREAVGAHGLGLPVFPVVEEGVGRAVLANDAGWGRWRDRLIAATYVTGAGEIVRMGCSVMKNVAGYDLFRPLIGSGGVLGVPVRLTFRLDPRPAAEPAAVREARENLLRAGRDDVLDLTVQAGATALVLAGLNREPMAVLPAVGRLFARLGADEALMLIRSAMRHGAVRALWNGRRLLDPDGLEKVWEDALRAVFDPDAILADWFSGGAP